MDIEIAEAEKDSINSEFMKRIAQNRTSITKFFVARIGDQDVGIITIDQYFPPNPLFVYYIFVENNYRNMGIGTKLLEFAEQMGISRGNPSIVLQPHEVETRIPIQVLVDWYIQKGYSWRENDPKRMEKSL